MQTNPTDHLPANDDLPVGRILSRREILALFGVAGGALVAAGCALLQPTTTQPGLNAEAATAVAMEGNATVEATATAELATVEAVNTATAPACVVRPELTEGPYFVDEQLERSDIRTNTADGTTKAGVPFTLRFNVSQISNTACSPLADAQVDIWHCDALGVYAGVTDRSFDTSGQDFLRGYQITNSEGVAEFTTIYPGWYQGRAVHIHFKIRLAAGTDQAYEFTSQFFFDDAFSDQIYTQAPYASKGQRNQLNSTDNIYQQSGGQLLLTPTAAGDGYAASFDIALDLSDTETGATDSGGPGGRPPGGG